jgi:hypothetical protein
VPDDQHAGDALERIKANQSLVRRSHVRTDG